MDEAKLEGEKGHLGEENATSGPCASTNDTQAVLVSKLFETG